MINETLSPGPLPNKQRFRPQPRTVGNYQSYPLYRFPKWLAAESYTITHQAGLPGRFTVTLLRGKGRLVGLGSTITEAARSAVKSQLRRRTG